MDNNEEKNPVEEPQSTGLIGTASSRCSAACSTV